MGREQLDVVFVKVSLVYHLYCTKGEFQWMSQRWIATFVYSFSLCFSFYGRSIHLWPTVLSSLLLQFYCHYVICIDTLKLLQSLCLLQLLLFKFFWGRAFSNCKKTVNVRIVDHIWEASMNGTRGEAQLEQVFARKSQFLKKNPQQIGITISPEDMLMQLSNWFTTPKRKCDKWFYSLCLLREHKSQKQGAELWLDTRIFDLRYKVVDVKGVNLSEELEACIEFLINSVFLKRRHRFFNLTLKTLDPVFCWKELDFVFDCFKFADEI